MDRSVLEMLFIWFKEFSVTMLLLAVVMCATDLPRYFRIEKKERKIEIDDRLSPSFPAAESYVIGVKRALLPFRQLSQYLKRPAVNRQNVVVSDRWDRKGTENPTELFQKTSNQKRWDRNDAADDYPEIILIRPVDASKIRTGSLKSADGGIRSKARSSNDRNYFLFDEGKCSHRKDHHKPDSPKKVNIDSDILQANGLNIKLTFSVDVGNQSNLETKANRGRMGAQIQN